MLIRKTLKITYYQIICSLCLCLPGLVAHGGDRVLEAVSTEPLGAGEVAELSASLAQLRARLAGADAVATAAALRQWAEQNRAQLEAAKVRLQAAREAELAASSSRQTRQPPEPNPTRSPGEQQLADLRYHLAVSKQAALAAIAEDDVKGRRDAMRVWLRTHQAELAQVQTLQAGLAAHEPSADERRVQCEQQLQVRLAMSDAAFAAEHPGLCATACRLSRLRAQWELQKVNFEEGVAEADAKTRRDAYREFLARTKTQREQIATLAAQVAAQQPAAAPEPEPTEAKLAQLSAEERLQFDVRRALDSGWQRILAANPAADEKQRRDLRREYLNQTRELQGLLR